MSEPQDAIEQMQDEAAAALADHGEAVVRGVIEAGRLQTWVDTLLELVDEAKVHFGDDGIRVSAVDPSNVAMWAPVELSPQAFESYDAPGQVTIGVPLTTLDERLGPANSGDLVELAIDMETRTLNLRFRNIEQSVALIDPDAIRQEPDTSDLDLDNRVVITGAQFDDAVTVADLVSDHVTIEARPDDRLVVFIGEGDTDDSTVAFGDDEVIDASVDSEGESLFSTNFMESFADAVPDDSEVTIRFDDEFPISLSWTACDGTLTVDAMCAPRIRNS